MFGHFKFRLSAHEVKLVIGVFAGRPKCASKRDTLVAFFRHILNSCAICLSDCFMLKGRWFVSSLMQPSRRFTVCISLSTSPIDRWSFAGANIILILFLLQYSFITFPVWDLALSIRMDLGTPCIAMCFVKKCSMFVAFASLYSLSVGNLENLSMHARKYTSIPCPSSIGPPKSICISSFGSTHGFIGDHLVFGIMLLRLLPNSVHVRHVFDLLIGSLFMSGHHNLCANSVIPHAPGCVAWSTFITASFIALGIVSRLSRRMHPSSTLSCFQCVWICLLTPLHLSSSPCVMQSRISRRTESVCVIAAISVELKTSRIALSSWESVLVGRSSSSGLR